MSDATIAERFLVLCESIAGQQAMSDDSWKPEARALCDEVEAWRKAAQDRYLWRTDAIMLRDDLSRIAEGPAFGASARTFVEVARRGLKRTVRVLDSQTNLEATITKYKAALREIGNDDEHLWWCRKCDKWTEPCGKLDYYDNPTCACGKSINTDNGDRFAEIARDALLKEEGK